MTNHATTFRARTLIAGLGLSLATSLVAADFPGFDDVTLGTGYNVADSDTSDGVFYSFGPMPWLTGGTGYGEARILGSDTCNTMHRLDLNNITAKFDFGGTIGVQTDMVILSRHNGGQINLTVNGSPIAYAGDWMAYHNSYIGGVRIEILSGGFSGDCTRILLRGDTEVVSIALQEGWVDTPDTCAEPTFDDLALGSYYATADSFTTVGIPCMVVPYINSMDLAIDGDVRISNANWSCGDVNEARHFSSAVEFDFSGLSGVNDLEMRVGDYGPGVNLGINGARIWAADWIDLDGISLGGCTVTLPSGGGSNECGVVEISGHIDTMVVGGEETAVDCIEWLTTGSGNTNPGPCLSYDEVPAIEFVISDTFDTVGVGCTIGSYWVDYGTSLTDGGAFAQPSMLACGSGQELAVYAACVDHDFKSTTGSMEGVSITAADHGGILNLGINGDLLIFDVFAEVDGAEIGGVTVRVVSGGGLNECTELEFDGVLDNLMIGGGQLFLDCLDGTVVETGDPADLDGDGSVNGQDLATLLANWNLNADGDINGDGATDGQDLAIMLGSWTN